MEVKTNIDYEVIIPEDAQDWVSHATTRALRTETLTFNISENSSDRTRSTEVYIKDRATSLQETLTINQIANVPGVYYVETMGALGTMLNHTQKDTITTMIVRGEINKADFDVMKLKMPQLRYIDLTDVRCEGDRIPTMAFAYNNSITTLLFPESVTIVGEMAFQDNSGLKTLNLPDGLKIIE